MRPNINENKRNRKATKRGRKRFFCASIFKERFNTIERVFAWEDKFKRLIGAGQDTCRFGSLHLLKVL